MVLLTSCSEIEEKVSTVMDKPKLEQCDGSFSSALSKFEIILLETNDDCLIGEIDVMKKRNGRYYIQSAYALPTDEKMNQELRPLINVNDFFKKIIIVREDIKPYSNEQGILIMGIKYFLLNNNSLEY